MRQVLGTALVMVAMLYAAHVNVHPTGGRPQWMVRSVVAPYYPPTSGAYPGWSAARDYGQEPETWARDLHPDHARTVKTAIAADVAALDRTVANLHKGLDDLVTFAIMWLDNGLDASAVMERGEMLADLHMVAA